MKRSDKAGRVISMLLEDDDGYVMPRGRGQIERYQEDYDDDDRQYVQPRQTMRRGSDLARRYVTETTTHHVETNDMAVNLSDRIRAKTGHHVPPAAIVFLAGAGGLYCLQQAMQYIAMGVVALGAYLLYVNKKRLPAGERGQERN